MSELTRTAPDPERPAGRTDRSAWNWLLALPLVTVLYPPLYNRADPALLGIPFFYWYQLAMIPVSVACTLLVYRRTGARVTGGSR